MKIEKAFLLERNGRVLRKTFTLCWDFAIETSVESELLWNLDKGSLHCVSREKHYLACVM